MRKKPFYGPEEERTIGTGMLLSGTQPVVFDSGGIPQYPDPDAM
jgi:hypothetical protein